jgi:hypothetical protein
VSPRYTSATVRQHAWTRAQRTREIMKRQLPDPTNPNAGDGSKKKLSLEDTRTQKMRGIPVKTRTPVGYNPYDTLPLGKSAGSNIEDTAEIAAGDTAEIPAPHGSSYEAVELTCSTSAGEQTADLILTEKNGYAHHFTIPVEQLRKLYLKIGEAYGNDLLDESSAAIGHASAGDR